MDVNTIAFLLLAALFAVYAMLDGFDLGVGMLSLFTRSREERELHFAAVGRVWDGNEAWLLAGGSVLLGAFPAVFAAVFGGFYLALGAVLLGLVARGVAMELRSRVRSARWTRVFELAFGVGSLLPAVLFGVVAGNVVRGVPIGADFTWRGSLVGLLNPYALLVGLLSSAFFVMQGALHLRGKVEGELARRMGRTALGAHAAFVALSVAVAAATAWVAPARLAHVATPECFPVILLPAGALCVIPLATRAGRTRIAFAASFATIGLAVLVAARSMYPVLVPSSLGGEHSLDIYDSATTAGTIRLMLCIAAVVVPIIAGHTIASYRVFGGPLRRAHARASGAPVPSPASPRHCFSTAATYVYTLASVAAGPSGAVTVTETLPAAAPAGALTATAVVVTARTVTAAPPNVTAAPWRSAPP